MPSALCAPMDREHPLIAWLIVLGAVAIALVSALPYAGSWNDGSRLAAVESIVDRHTLAIDDSVFVHVPANAATSGCAPYPVQNADLLEFGTRDKLLIQGHFYSDKPTVISFLMAGWYWLCERCGLPRAAERPDLFCRIMTAGTSGLAYVVAVWCIYGFGRRAGLPLLLRLILTGSFALATVALPYTRHVNNHILLLGVTALLFAQLLQLADDMNARSAPWPRLAIIGTLGGLAYSLDLGSGPLLLMCLLPLVAYRTQRPAPVAVFVLAAASWLIVHHVLNYAIGGTLKPMNTVPEYSQWPGCPFTPENMTGFWTHGPSQLVVYALALLFGKHGFIGHNLPLFVLLPALFHRRLQNATCGSKDKAVAAQGSRVRFSNLKFAIASLPFPAELVFGCIWCCGTWLLYSAFSNNFGGACCSIRWFVPFLAPAYYGLALLLGRFPSYRIDFCILSGWGVLLGAIMWWNGPWILHLVPLFWPIQAAALLSWLGYRLLSGGVVSDQSSKEEMNLHITQHSTAQHSPSRTMNVAQMRGVDRWLGAPVCFLLTRLRHFFRRSAPPERPRSILFVKLAEQGSTVLAQAALQAAIRRVGKDNVYFLLFAENRPILDLLDLIPSNHIIAIHARGLFRTVVSAIGAVWKLRRAGIDAAVDLEFFARASAALCYLSGARWRVGYHAFRGEAAYRGDLMTHRVSFNPYLHTAQTFQILVEALDRPGDQFPSFDLKPPPLHAPEVQFHPQPEELRQVRSLLKNAFGHDLDGGLVLLNPNASDLIPLRRWPTERYLDVARRFLECYPGACIAFTGAPGEAQAVARLAEQVGSRRCVSLAGKTTLRQLLVLYGLADVLVTNDSGPAHFATLTPIEVVVLFGPETPRLFAASSPRTHPLWAGLACSPCINAFNNRNSPCGNNVCMQRITIEQVLDEVCRLYEARHRTGLRRSA